MVKSMHHHHHIHIHIHIHNNNNIIIRRVSRLHLDKVHLQTTLKYAMCNIYGIYVTQRSNSQ
jgi:C4-dicarboxylate transporter